LFQSFIDGMSFYKHALVKNARYQYSSGFWPIKDNVSAVLDAPQARANLPTCATQFRVVGQSLATGFEIVEITSGLVHAPSA
jgi:hypothetical protein